MMECDAQKAPDAVPEIAHSDSGVHSIDSLSSEAVNVPSYSEQQKAAEETAEAVKRDAQKAADQVSQDAKDFGKNADSEAQRLQAQAGKKAQQLYKDAGEEYDKVKDGVQKEYDAAKKNLTEDEQKAQQKAKKAEAWIQKNKDNPVVIGNVVVVGTLAALLGAGAYRLQKAGTLSWKVGGVWAGAVGLFAVGDYFASS